MKMILPVFLALCLGVAPMFGEGVKTPAAETVSVEAEQSAVESNDAAAQPVISEAAAVVPAETEQAAMFGSEVPQISMASAFGAMGLVLCLLVGAYFGIKKFAPGLIPATASSTGNNLKIVESLGMGDRRSIALVEVGGKRFLIGSTPQQINMLTALPEHISLVDESNDASTVSAIDDEGERKTFRNIFEIGRKRPAARYSEKVIPDEIRQKMRRLREALEHR